MVSQFSDPNCTPESELGAFQFTLGCVTSKLDYSYTHRVSQSFSCATAVDNALPFPSSTGYVATK